MPDCQRAVTGNSTLGNLLNKPYHDNNVTTNLLMLNVKENEQGSLLRMHEVQ